MFLGDKGIPTDDVLIIVANRGNANEKIYNLIDALERNVQIMISHSQQNWEFFSSLDRKCENKLNRIA